MSNLNQFGRRNYECPRCGYIGDISDFILDWVYSEGDDDERPSIACPECDFSNESEIVAVE